MYNILNLSKEQQKLLFETTARRMGVIPTIVEKDFWVCIILDYLFNFSQFKDYFIFKGGTSLSKCYGVISRFSEDIDLIIKYDKLGFDSGDIFKQRTITQNYKFEQKMNLVGSEFIQNALKNDLLTNLCSNIPCLKIISDPVDQMVLYISYPAIFGNDYILSSVKLEIGPVALQTPREKINISPYCIEDYSKATQTDLTVDIISIARTFWEKILILTAEVNRPIEKKTPSRYSRHYYDVYKIYKSNYFDSIIKDLKLFENVKEFKAKYYRTSWAKVDECEIKTIILIPNQNRLDDLKSDYKNMKYMLFDNAPTFDEIIDSLRMLENVLKSVNIDN